MKKLTIIFIFCISFSYAQTGDTNHKPTMVIGRYDTIAVSSSALKTLADFDKQIKELQDKQNLYLRGLFEGKNYDVDKVKDLRFEKGKFIFKTEK